MTNSVDLKLFKETSSAILAKKIVDEEDFFPIFLLKIAKNKVKDPELKNKIIKISNILEKTTENKDISKTTIKTYVAAIDIIFLKKQAAPHRRFLSKAIFKYFKTNNEAMISLILKIGFKDPQEKRALALEALERQEKNIVRFLFAQGETNVKKIKFSNNQADVSSSHRYYSPLHFFAYDKNKEVVVKLLAEGGKINDIADDKFTPFDSALARASALVEDDFATARSMIQFCGASFETALAIKFYGLLLRKKGFYNLNKKCSISYEGFNYYYSAEQLGKWGGSFFATQKEKLINEFSLDADDCKWLETVFKNVPEYCKNSQKLAQDIKDKQTVILCAGWGTHIIALVAGEDIRICNRGSGSRPRAGVHVYSKDLQKETELIDFCKQLQIKATKKTGRSLLYQEVGNPALNQEIAEKLGLVHQYDLPLPRQEGGHCGWDSIEAAFIGTVDLYLTKYKKMNQESSSELAKKIGKLWVEEYVIPGVKKELSEKHKIKPCSIQLSTEKIRIKKPKPMPTKAKRNNINKAYDSGLRDLTRSYMERFPLKNKKEVIQQILKEKNRKEITSWGFIEVLGKEKPKTEKKQKLIKNEIAKEVKRIDKRYEKDKYGTKKGKEKKESSSSSSSDSDSPKLKRKIKTKKGKEKNESFSSTSSFSAASSDSDSPKLKRKNHKKK